MKSASHAFEGDATSALNLALGRFTSPKKQWTPQAKHGSAGTVLDSRGFSKGNSEHIVLCKLC